MKAEGHSAAKAKSICTAAYYSYKDKQNRTKARKKRKN